MMTTMTATTQENIWKKLDKNIVGVEPSHHDDDDDVANIDATNDWDVLGPPRDLQQRGSRQMS